MMIRHLLIALLLVLALTARAQRPFMQDVWMNENRTPLRANVMLRDSKGYLLVGTDQGLMRYNGTTFKVIRSAIEGPVTALCERQGKLWVGYKSGRLGFLLNDSLYLFRHKQYKPAASITSIHQSVDSTIWLSTEEGILRLSKDKVTAYNSVNGLTDDFVYQLVFIDEGRLLAGTDQGINDISLQQGKPLIKTFTADQGLQDNIARVVKSAGEPGKYWIGAQQGGLSLYDSRRHACHKLQIAGGWQWGQVNDILPVSPGKAWVATDDGYLLEVVKTAPDAAIVNSYACPDKKINAMLLDKSGNIWCATTKGISLVTAEFLNYFSLITPYSLSEVTALCCDHSNNLWLALNNELYVVGLNDNIKMLRKVFTTAQPVSALYCSADGTLWAGTSGDGLWCKTANATGFRKVAGTELDKENVLSISAAGNHLWVSGLNGVKEFERSVSGLHFLKTHNKASGIGSDYIYQLFADRRNHVWMATDGAGVCLYKEDQYYHWDTFTSPGSNVAYTLTEDAEGHIWAGTLYKDLFRLANGRWENIRRKEVQDIDVNLSTVNANATGQVVAVYQRCIDLWYPGSRFFRHFNSRHGMGMDSTSRVLNCSARDTAGNIYIPFEKGILVFKNQEAIYDIRPEVNIIRISNNLRNIDMSRNEFGPGENYLSFYFDGISFTNPERLNYRFRLEGYSDNWVYTNDPLATFAKLPPGTFTFRVQVSLNGGFDNAGETSYVFRIARPVWQRAWFIFLLVVGATLIAYGFIKFRDRKMQRLAQLEQERVLFDYEHLKSQVNPHFLFNSLNTLTNLIEENKDNAIAYTERLSDLYRNMLIYHNKDLISLSEEWMLLSAYLYIQQSRFGSALQLTGNIPGPIKESKKIPPMALQLLMENAIKHNIVSLSSPLIVEISATEEELVVKNKINPKIKKELESGIGLANISNRYALLTQRKVYFGREGDYWVVKLPLL
jgi:ligand-binding sensor domain-containing protein